MAGRSPTGPSQFFYFRDPTLQPAFIVPAVDLHLAMDSTWIGDVRAYAMAEFFTDIDTYFYDDFFAAAKAILADRRVRSMVVGTEGESLPAGFKTKLEDLLHGNRIVDFSAADGDGAHGQDPGRDPPPKARY